MPVEGQQVGLDLWPREHDLPPRWDGLPVEWGDWSDTAAVIICPPTRHPDRCDHCGTTRPRLINIGRVWTDEASAPAAIGRARLHRNHHAQGNVSSRGISHRVSGSPSTKCAPITLGHGHGRNG